MKQQVKRTQQLYLLIGAALGCFALIAQLYLIIENRVTSIPEAIVRFFSFYTILTNILTALCFICLLSKTRQRLVMFFSRPATLTAITVYITVVGLVYNIILRQLWSPTGLQYLVDELLHTIIPILVIIYWLLFAQKNRLKWKDALQWLIYPFVYIIYVLVRGSLSGFYPYPFINAKEIGYHKTFTNSLMLTILFLFISLLYIGIGKIAARVSR